MLIPRLSVFIGLACMCSAGPAAFAASDFPVARREILQQPPAWFASASARTLGERIVALQGAHGGWSNWSNEVGEVSTA